MRALIFAEAHKLISQSTKYGMALFTCEVVFIAVAIVYYSKSYRKLFMTDFLLYDTRMRKRFKACNQKTKENKNIHKIYC